MSKGWLFAKGFQRGLKGARRSPAISVAPSPPNTTPRRSDPQINHPPVRLCMMNLPRVSSLAVLVILVGVSACGCMSQETVVSDEEKARVLEYADPIADNVLLGFDEGKYTVYREFVTSRLGFYVSRDNPVVTERGEYITVTYRANFEREDGVSLRLVFRKGDESHQLSGLWFDSPMLRS